MSIKRVLIAGEGGQGIQTMAHIITRTAFAEKKKVTFLPNFGIEQRGGVSLAFIQISDTEISFPKFEKADILLIMAERAVGRVKNYVTKGTVIMFDNSLINENKLSDFSVPKVAIPASYIASKELVPKVFNMVMLGGLFSEIGGLSWKVAESEIESYFADKIKKEPELKHFNLKAFEIGEEAVKGLK